MDALQPQAMAQDAPATGSASSLHSAKRALLLRDSLTFLVLTVATLVLYAATSFLFRSFEERRADLAQVFTKEGKTALAANRPDQAIAAFRSALSYAPDDRANHLLLAEALAMAGHSEEATSYFLSLREAEPGDGFINLELARLARKKGDTTTAIEYYRASSLGTWNGDSMSSRRTVQLELADYLVQSGDLPAARAEILLAAADTPESASLDIAFGDRLAEALDSADALNFYRKAVKLAPHDAAGVSRLGRLLYRTGEYPAAHEYLDRALRQEPRTAQDEAQSGELRSLAQDAERMQSLVLSADLPSEVLEAHLRADAKLAKARLAACAASQGGVGSSGGSAPLQALVAEWQSVDKANGRHAAAQDTADASNVRSLIFRTEMETARQCGAPTGDDRLLLQLAEAYAAH
jgi:tetratricopeptide (TPR) repeat protein